MDTLMRTKKLEALGFDRPRAEGLVLMVQESIDEEVAKKSDLDKLENSLKLEMGKQTTHINRVDTDLKTEIKRVETDLKTEIKRVETDLKTEIKRVETELKSDIKEVRSDMKVLSCDLLLKLGALMITLGGIMTGILIDVLTGVITNLLKT